MSEIILLFEGVTCKKNWTLGGNKFINSYSKSKNMISLIDKSTPQCGCEAMGVGDVLKWRVARDLCQRLALFTKPLTNTFFFIKTVFVIDRWFIIIFILYVYFCNDMYTMILLIVIEQQINKCTKKKKDCSQFIQC